MMTSLGVESPSVRSAGQDEVQTPLDVVLEGAPKAYLSIPRPRWRGGVEEVDSVMWKGATKGADEEKRRGGRGITTALLCEAALSLYPR